MPETEQKIRYCPNCGGAMEFHIGKQKIAIIAFLISRANGGG